MSGTRRSSPGGRRIPAGEIEQLVEARITVFLTNEPEIFDAIVSIIEDVNLRRIIFDRAADLAKRWPDLEPSEKCQLVRNLISRVEVTPNAVKISIRPERVATVVAPDSFPSLSDTATKDAPRTMILTIPARLKRAGKETKFLIEGRGGERRDETDRSMLRLLAQAHHFFEMVMQSQGKTISELASEAGVDRSYFSRVLRLRFLAPAAVKTILRGNHPLELTAKRLTLRLKLPIRWNDQISEFGIQ